MSTGVRLEGDLEPPRAEDPDIAPGELHRDPGIPLAMNDEDSEIPAAFQSGQGAEASGEPSVDRHHPREPLGVAQGDSVGQRGPFAATDQEDSFGVNVQGTAGLTDGVEEPVFQGIHRVDRIILEPLAHQLRFGAWGGGGNARASKPGSGEV